MIPISVSKNNFKKMAKNCKGFPEFVYIYILELYDVVLSDFIFNKWRLKV
ncbi:hypothetical protein HMPREF9104_00923 [Lentilactobacillus kisonensis F0435]|uniref:Uncharacterized protein n=1 Tax=Lentilactobacillus kisonensis F0435 TaxID=797516 RepID=H1LE97_9LACO|nr:hypothetical protein HMPREF9104_00923 [Lentilactobacillus kisonensis F0435]